VVGASLHGVVARRRRAYGPSTGTGPKANAETESAGKPFSYPELRLRVAALLRRAQGRRRHGRLRAGALSLDPATREVRLRGRRVELAQKEFALLRALAADPTRVLTKDELLRTVWGFRARGTTRTLDSHACRLRQKLGRDGDRFVVNVWGVGYRLVDGAGEE